MRSVSIHLRYRKIRDDLWLVVTQIQPTTVCAVLGCWIHVLSGRLADRLVRSSVETAILGGELICWDSAQIFAFVSKPRHLIHYSLLTCYGRPVLSWIIRVSAQRLFWAIVCIMTFLLAVKTDDSGIASNILWVERHDLNDLVLRLFIFLAVRWLVPELPAVVAYNRMVVPRWPRVLRKTPDKWVQLAIHPIFVERKVCHFVQWKVLRSNHVFNMFIVTVRAQWTKAESIIKTNFVSYAVPVVTILTKFAKSSLIIGTLLMLLRRSWVVRLVWMPIYTSFLLVTVTPLLEKSTDWYLFLHESMQVLARVSFVTILLEPMNADLLFDLFGIVHRVDWRNYLLDCIEVQLFSLHIFLVAHTGTLISMHLRAASHATSAEVLLLLIVSRSVHLCAVRDTVVLLHGTRKTILASTELLRRLITVHTSNTTLQLSRCKAHIFN